MRLMFLRIGNVVSKAGTAGAHAVLDTDTKTQRRAGHTQRMSATATARIVSPPKSYVRALTASATVFGDGALNDN